MSALRTNRLREFGWGGELDRLFNSFFGTLPEPVRGDGVRVNVWQHEGAFFVEAELPGVAEADLNLSVSGEDLTIAGSRDDNRFERIVRLPVKVDAEAVEASLERGVLLVKLPETAATRPRNIEISHAGK